MDEFQKLLLEEIRENRKEFNHQISKLREETKDDMKLLWSESNKQRTELALFKGKALGLLTILTLIFNAGMSYFTKK